MLFKFKSHADSDLIMLEADARKLLKIMLGDDPVKGIVLVQDMPRCMAALENAVLQEEQARQQAADEAIAEGQQDASALGPVRLSQRAAPMLKLLRRSLAESSDVVWGV
jgi:hypothetical protein